MGWASGVEGVWSLGFRVSWPSQGASFELGMGLFFLQGFRWSVSSGFEVLLCPLKTRSIGCFTHPLLPGGTYSR